MEYIPPNYVRACWQFVAFVFTITGAGILWGVGGMLIVTGLLFYCDFVIDEAVERFTNKTRWKP